MKINMHPNPRPTHLLDPRAARADLTLLRRRPRTGPRCEARGCRSQAGTSASNSLLLGLPVQGAASLALLTRRRMRASIALRSAQLTVLRLRSRRHCRCCRRASQAPRLTTRLRLGLWRLWLWQLCHLGPTRPPRSGGDLRGGCPEPEARGGRPVPRLRAARPELAVAPEPACHLRVAPRQCPRAHALLPGAPVSALDLRVPVRARNNFTGTQHLAAHATGGAE